jgi:acyl-homoserine-lactone acylase
MEHVTARRPAAPRRRTSRRRTAVGVAAVLVASVVAGATPVAAEDAVGASGHTAPRLDAEIRRTEFGIPHIKASDWASLGYGYGYAFAEDNLCLLAEMVVTGNAQRSRFLGASTTNLQQDLFHQQLIDQGVIEATLATPPDAPVPGPTQKVRDLIAGTARGVNRYLRDVGGAAGVGDPRCAGAEWVRPITELDLWRTYLDSAVRAGRGALLTPIVTAQPPGAGAAAATAAPDPGADLSDLAEELPAEPVTDIGSNAYGLGREATVDGTGMLLGNPHFPWEGRDRFYEMHLTIPGEYDMIGAALSGQPVVQIGHNETMGWSHTVSTARRFTLYELQLVPGNPTQYVVDGEIRDMTADEVEVEVADEDGNITTETRTLWSSEYGPIAVVAPLTWSETTAYAVRDVNEDAGRTFDGYLAMGRASSTRALKDVLDTWQHLPWINTIAADSAGEAFYGDHSVVPGVDDAKLEACITPIGRAALDQLNVFILDGSDSDCGWATEEDSRVPGILGPSSLPTLFRTDYVTNSNDSYWLTNPAQPLEGFARIIGTERTPRSLRTRLGIIQVEERLAGTDGLEGRGFTLDQLQEVMFSNRVLGGELARDDLVELCRANPTVTVDGAAVDLTEACDALAGWDLRVDLDSRGAHVFRQFAAAGGLVWAVPFDPTDPVATPNTLAVDDPAVLAALGTAVKTLTDAGIPLDARLGDLQSEQRGRLRIPIHGGTGQEGAFNIISAPFDGRTGYPDVRSGASFILAAEFTPQGPRSRAILAYSNATDPTSPHFGDQTELYSSKRWVDLDYREADILADPALTTLRISEILPPSEVPVDDLCAAVTDPEPFDDIAGDTFVRHIACLAHARITTGVGPGNPDDPRLGYFPERDVSRGAMASFIARTWDRAVALDVGDELVPLPPATGPNRFVDVGRTDAHRDSINRLAAVGVTLGGPGGRPADQFGPGLPVSRGQMATFITAALEAMLDTSLAVDEDYFTDDTGNVHESNINAVADAGIATGNGYGRFFPTDTVSRGQMAAFLVRTLAYLEVYDFIDPLPAR